MNELIPDYREIIDQCDFLEAGTHNSVGMPVEIKVDVDKLIETVSKAYSDIAIAREEQKTEREKIRKTAELITNQMHQNTIKYRAKLDKVFEERMRLIDKISELISNKEIDDKTIEIIKMILEYLNKSANQLECQNNNLLDVNL